MSCTEKMLDAISIFTILSSLILATFKDTPLARREGIFASSSAILLEVIKSLQRKAVDAPSVM
jgi:hypothetical protein